MSRYFPKPCKNFEVNINVKVDLSNYATKTDIKNWSKKLAIDKLVPVPADLSKLSDVVKMTLKKLCMIN